MATPKSFIKANSQMEFQKYTVTNPKQLSRLESLKGKLLRSILFLGFFIRSNSLVATLSFNYDELDNLPIDSLLFGDFIQ